MLHRADTLRQQSFLVIHINNIIWRSARNSQTHSD